MNNDGDEYRYWRTACRCAFTTGLCFGWVTMYLLLAYVVHIH